MPPRLLFPVPVVIEPIDKASTEYQRAAREPVRQVARATEVELDAQVSWSSLERTEAGRGGFQEKSNGYLVFLIADLEALAYTPARGDKVTSIGGVSGRWYLTSFEGAATRIRTHTLLIANFEDRQPVARGSDA